MEAPPEDTPQFAAERQSQIAEMVAARGKVLTSQLTVTFGVSEPTCVDSHPWERCSAGGCTCIIAVRNKRCINEKHLELLNPSEGEDASGAIEVMVKKANQSERETFLKAIKEPI